MNEQPLNPESKPIVVSEDVLAEKQDSLRDPLAFIKSVLLRNGKRVGGYLKALPAVLSMGTPIANDISRSGDLDQMYGTPPQADVTHVYPQFNNGTDTPFIFGGNAENQEPVVEQTSGEDEPIPDGFIELNGVLIGPTDLIQQIPEGVGIRLSPEVPEEGEDDNSAPESIIPADRTFFTRDADVPGIMEWREAFAIVGPNGPILLQFPLYISARHAVNGPTANAQSALFDLYPDLLVVDDETQQQDENGERLVEVPPSIVSTSVTMFNEQINAHITDHPELATMFVPTPVSEMDGFTVEGIPHNYGFVSELVRTVSGVETLPISGIYRGSFEITLEISGVSISQIVLVQEIPLINQTQNTVQSQFFLYGVATGTSDAYSPVFRVPGNDFSLVNTENPIPNLLTHNEVNGYITDIEPGTQFVVELVPAAGEPPERYITVRDHFSQGIAVNPTDIESESWAFTPFSYYVGDGEEVAVAEAG